MNTSLKWLSMMALVLSLATPAFAQAVPQSEGDESDIGGDEATEEGSEDTPPATYGETNNDAAQDDVGVLAVSGYPLQAAARPLTLARGMLNIIASPVNPFRLDGGLTFTHPGVNLTIDTPIAIDFPTVVTFTAGVAYAPIDNLEIGAMVLPLQFNQGGGYNNPSIYGLYRFLDGQFEVAGGAVFNIPVNSGSDFGMLLGLPMYYHVNSTLRIDTGVLFGLDFSDPIHTSLNVPIGVTANVTDNVFVGARTGLGFGDLSNAGDSFGMPLYLQGGYTLANNATGGPCADLVLQFGLPSFLALGASEPTSKLQTAFWQLTVGANVYLNP